MINAPVQPGDVLAGKYRVDRVLGVGGMGVVVRAVHVHLGERVALKFMLPEAMANADVATRFLREARLAVKLKSEHVAKVLDVGTLDTGAPYIVMEYLDGTDLDAVLGKHGPLPFADVAEYVIQACDAIAEAHALGIVHRDLKPANLFLTHRLDGAPLVKVLDFGISKASQLGEVDGGMTKTSAIMGSPYFMSPEQMRSSKDVDARSDVWSVGVILYQLLTGRLPFEAETLGGIMAAVLQEEPAPLSVHRPDVPQAFEAIVRRCLVRNREARAQNVAEIATTLAAHAPMRARAIADRVASLLGAGRGTVVIGSQTEGPPVSGRTPVLGAAPPGLATGAMSTTTAPRSGAGTSFVLGILVAGLVVAGGGWLWSRGTQSAAPAAASVALTAEGSAGSTPPAVAPSAVPVPPSVVPSSAATAEPLASASASAEAPRQRSIPPSSGARRPAVAPPPPPPLPPPAPPPTPKGTDPYRER